MNRGQRFSMIKAELARREMENVEASFYSAPTYKPKKKTAVVEQIARERFAGGLTPTSSILQKFRKKQEEKKNSDPQAEVDVAKMWSQLLAELRNEESGKSDETRKYWGLPRRPLYDETYESDIAHAVAKLEFEKTKESTKKKSGSDDDDDEYTSKNAYFERIGGLLLHEVHVVGAVIRYQLLDTMDRAKYHKLYIALKEHMRLFFRSSYNEFQKIMWMYSNGLLRAIFSSDRTAYMREAADMLISNVTLGPAMLGQVLMDKFMSTIGASLPGGKTKLPVVIICGLIVVIGVVAEVTVAYKTKNYTSLVAWLLSELNKVVIKSSFRYKNVLRIIVRVFQMIGGRRSQLIMSTIAAVQSPIESFAAFSRISKYRTLDDMVRAAGSRKELKGSVYSLLDRLDSSRAVHRASVPFSIFHASKKKSNGWF